MENVKDLEKVVKGFANHHRIKILMLLEKQPKLTLIDIAQMLKINFRTAGEHTRKLMSAELISKKYRGASVEHTITYRGKQVLKFCRILE